VTILVRGTDPCPPTIKMGQPNHVRPEISPEVLAAIDLLNVGILVLDHEGRITFANRAAKKFLQGSGRRHRFERDASFDRIGAATANREDAEGCLTLSTSNRNSLIALSLPFHTDRGTGASSSTLFVYDPTVEPELDLRPITRLYGLTRAEARLLEALVRGERVGTYAKNAGITLNTAKGYLKQLFSKTHTRRQSDLLRLVLSNPLLRLMRPDQALTSGRREVADDRHEPPRPAQGSWSHAA
jgi:DNA-binding CsgD family transcriptional regulator